LFEWRNERFLLPVRGCGSVSVADNLDEALDFVLGIEGVQGSADKGLEVSARQIDPRGTGPADRNVDAGAGKTRLRFGRVSEARIVPMGRLVEAFCDQRVLRDGLKRPDR
jgi:hypothetical protein